MDTTHLTITQYAKILGVDTSTIRRRILAGKFPATKYGKTWIINVDEVNKKK
jgi:excisionase family DNA binding protein